MQLNKSARSGALLALCLAFTGSARCGDIEASVRDGNGRPIGDAVVLARTQGAAPALVPMQTSIDQVDKEFVPHVRVIVAGSSISFPNKDDIRHQVYSFSPAKRFELPLYAGTPSTPILFDKPGVVTLGCNIHDWMAAYVYVADTPYFATTAKNGKAVLRGLPDGDYVLQVWHPRMEGAESETARRLRAPTGEKVSWTLELKPELRPRRAPMPGGGGYR